jgi:hypothetical protein
LLPAPPVLVFWRRRRRWGKLGRGGEPFEEAKEEEGKVPGTPAEVGAEVFYLADNCQQDVQAADDFLLGELSLDCVRNFAYICTT